MLGQLAKFVRCWFAECEVVLDHHEMATTDAERDVHRRRPELWRITDRGCSSLRSPVRVIPTVESLFGRMRHFAVLPPGVEAVALSMW
jgi:hypothetical protein